MLQLLQMSRKSLAESHRFVRTREAHRDELAQDYVEVILDLIEEDGEPSVKDAMMIACAQKVEHYEIATYGTLCTWAETLGYTKALQLLKQNIAEEEAADKKLSQIAKSINQEALAPA